MPNIDFTPGEISAMLKIVEPVADGLKYHAENEGFFSETALKYTTDTQGLADILSATKKLKEHAPK